MTTLDRPGQAAATPITPPHVAGQACRCGHEKAAHEHFRAGKDCGACDCGRFRKTKVR